LWNTEPGKEGLTFTATTTLVIALTYCPDGKTVAWGGLGGITVLDVREKKERPLGDRKAVISALAYSPDGKMLASASEDHSIKLWDAATGKLKATFKGHTDTVASLAFSPDHKTLASASHDDTVKLWAIPGTP
jgi:WD40 repeat protein